MMQNIVIMGGGVIGLSCAFELRKRGHNVTLLEIGKCGGQASGAAAGMLAPYSENLEEPDEFFRLCLDSLRLYPAWQAEIRQMSGQAFEYANSGSLYAVYHEADILALEGRLLWQRDFGSSGRIVEGEELRRIEPGISGEVKAALYTPEESHIYSPYYVQALEQVCRDMGVRIFEHLESVDIDDWQAELAKMPERAQMHLPLRAQAQAPLTTGPGQLLGLLQEQPQTLRREIVVKSKDGRKFPADRLVVCSGAWAQELSGTIELPLPIYPIRGQICAYDNARHTVRGMVFNNQGYVVAKGNGTVVCGASEDIAGFDTTVTEKGIERLRKWNKRLFPSLGGEVPFHKWAGLRPSTQDGRPLLGGLEAAEQIVFAAGHYRNGILLSPITAKIVADVIDGLELPSYYPAFAPERFNHMMMR
ncbi:FAD-dependent oxidoreductase [Paenibacillus fonticola]|uniref:FAD-dependent oxidoreductase n=1 Tax=Paenibacillus fonticola TaxID=379896 RepID=UPI000376CD24|nr:FAD-dependent oxidoreductase [Paenibacillus fonticola]